MIASVSRVARRRGQGAGLAGEDEAKAVTDQMPEVVGAVRREQGAERQ